MYISNLKLNNFRNYNSLNIDFQPSVNVIYGKNGYGKTNLLEAMFLCCIGKSFRTSHESELIKQGTDEYNVCVRLENNISRDINISYNKEKRRDISVDGLKIEKIRFLLGRAVGIIFSPETIRLVNDGPSERRKFLDMTLCQLSSEYYYNLYVYTKSLEEKNKILCGSNYGYDKLLMSVINEKLAVYGAKVAIKRFETIQKIGEFSKHYYGIISEEEEELFLRYRPSGVIFGDNEYNENKISEAFYNELTSNEIIQRELDNKRSVIGPQRDDFDIILNGLSLKTYGSQGQKRSATVALKLAELGLVKEVSGRTPILFLDDVLSELDNRRKGKILELTGELQTFYTCAEKSDFIIDRGMKNADCVNFIEVENLR